MGCDIHAFVEVKYKGVNGWHLYSTPDIKRNYSLFEKMAGVRGSLDNAYRKPKGLPEDISLVVRKEYEHWGSDAYTPSTLSLFEAQTLEAWAQVEFNELAIFGCIRGNGFGSDFPDDLENARLVFWFDN